MKVGKRSKMGALVAHTCPSIVYHSGTWTDYSRVVVLFPSAVTID